MKKKWTVTLGLLTLSALFVGCNSNHAPKEPIASEETQTITEGKTEDLLTSDSDSSETADSTQDTSSEEELAQEDTNQLSEESTNETDSTDANITEETSSNIVAQSTPTNKPNSETKPQSSTSSNTSTKPESVVKPNTTKPNTSPKPQASTKPNASPAPSDKPVSKPNEETAKPETQPESKPETKPESNNTLSLSCSEIFNKITNNMDTSAHMEMDATLLNDFYGIDANLLEDYCVQLPMLSHSITEIGVFKVKDVNTVSSIVAGINKRVSDIGHMLYPSLEQTFESRQLITNGQYILFAISNDAASIASNFNSLF